MAEQKNIDMKFNVYLDLKKGPIVDSYDFSEIMNLAQYKLEPSSEPHNFNEI